MHDKSNLIDSYLSFTHEEATVVLLDELFLPTLKLTVFQVFPLTFNFFHVNFLIVRVTQAEIIIVKRLIQDRSNVTRVRVEPGSCDEVRHKNNTVNLSATLQTLIEIVVLSSFFSIFFSFVCFVHIFSWFANRFGRHHTL